MTRRTTKARAVARRTGSIIKIEGAKGVSFKLKFDLPTDVKGERRTHYKTVRGTYAAAEAELGRLTGQAGEGVNLTDGKQPLSQWIETWLKDHAHVGISQRTFERYAELLRNHVAPRIGHHPLNVIGPMYIEKLYNELAESGRKQSPVKEGEAKAEAVGLAERTIRHTHRVLFQCLRDAKRFRLVTENVAADVKKRRINQSDELDETTDADSEDTGVEMHVLTMDRILELWEAVRAANLKSVPYPLAVLAFDSGARRGELLACRWSDLDFDKRALRIVRAVKDTKKNGITFGKPKTKSSRRTITLSQRAIAELRAWRAKLTEDRWKLGLPLPADALIFPLSVETPSEPLRPREVTKAFSRLVKREGFAPFRWHDWRHSCASHLLNQHVPVPQVSKHLGHSSPAITMSIYAHAIPKAEGGQGLLDQLMPLAAE